MAEAKLGLSLISPCVRRASLSLCSMNDAASMSAATNWPLTKHWRASSMSTVASIGAMNPLTLGMCWESQRILAALSLRDASSDLERASINGSVMARA